MPTGGARRLLLALLLAAACFRAGAETRFPAGKAEAARLTWYTGLSVPIARALAAEFGRRHPGIVISVTRPYPLFEPGPAQGAHWEKADVVTDAGLEARLELRRSGAFARLDFLSRSLPALCPWVSDSGGDFVYTHATRIPILFHRASVSDHDAPDSLAVLAHPRWNGKVALLAPSGSWDAECLYRFVVTHPALGFPWLERMRDNDAMLLLSPLGIREAVGSGVRPAAWGADYRVTEFVGERSAREGAPLMLYATAINRRAPHPAAARAFVSWLLDPATQKYMAAENMSIPLLKGACAQLEQGPVCGRSVTLPSSGREEFTRKVWKTLLGDAHISR
ncbi:MAG: hypothetical protein HY403_09780 [Elusimicrobia bacterium]|nr:hypothetical protein [Elusimicrobiota bacterium]